MRNALQILGIRGIPAKHGGFETFAERLAPHLAAHGWDITVYCQETRGKHTHESSWRGVRLIHIPVTLEGPRGTVVFDFKSTLLALRGKGGILTLGYNTAAFCALFRLKGLYNVINMDGIEWRRQKWSLLEKSWLWANERFGCWFGNHLIADHPAILEHLATRVGKDKITMIPYGADEVFEADDQPLRSFGLERRSYALVIARPEPENSILPIVRAYSAVPRSVPLVMLGEYNEQRNPYHRAVKAAASDGVIFLGALYDQKIVQALRFHTRLYIHGHTVGGTNPSLVEALGAGSPVLAHDNRFNRWVAGDAGLFFAGETECHHRLDEILDDQRLLDEMRRLSRSRHKELFTWDTILAQYERLLAESQTPPS